MLNILNERLKEIQIKLRERDKLSSQLTHTLKELDLENVRMDTLRNTLAKEERDVSKLEGLSLLGLFYNILGSKEEELEKESQELLLAKLKFDEAKSTVEKLQIESARLVTEMEEIEDLEVEFYQLLKEKENYLNEIKSPLIDELFKLSELEGSMKSYQKELKEAIAAGENSINALTQALEDLESAENWGVWDMLGGGMISTAVKHSKIDLARNAVNQVQYNLKIFQRELADIQMEAQSIINIDGLTKFADYFFDNLITDWIVQRKINDSIEIVNNKRTEIKTILSHLITSLVKTDEDIIKVNEEYIKVLTQTVN